MLDLDAIDLGELSMALEDHSYESSWWVDPRTGALRYHNPDVDAAAEGELGSEGLVYVDPIDSSEAYADMEDFVSQVGDRRAADLLGRAIAGRGAFRRFKDTLFDFPELRTRWFDFHDVRMRRRAIWWLADHGLVSSASAERAAAQCPDPRLDGPAGKHDDLVTALVEDLRALYGSRLSRVLVFGSYARGEAAEDSDLDLVVVLDDMPSAWAELRRMDELLWRHTQGSGTVVSAFPMTAEQFDRPTSPVQIRAKAEATPVT